MLWGARRSQLGRPDSGLRRPNRPRRIAKGGSAARRAHSAVRPMVPSGLFFFRSSNEPAPNPGLSNCHCQGALAPAPRPHAQTTP